MNTLLLAAARLVRLALLIVLSTGCAQAADRSSSARAAFVKANPCPATGEPRGACSGYMVDHIHPHCTCGVDHHSNTQWQTVEDGKIKYAEEEKAGSDSRFDCDDNNLICRA